MGKFLEFPVYLKTKVNKTFLILEDSENAFDLLNTSLKMIKIEQNSSYVFSPIVLNTKLDYETTKNYNLTLQLCYDEKDNKTSEIESICEKLDLEVSVKDENEPPVFKKGDH